MTQKEIIKKLTEDTHRFVNEEDPTVRVLNLFLNDWFDENGIRVEERKLLDPLKDTYCTHTDDEVKS